ncbi:MAG: DUF192 domain-containing protein [Phycisphaerae bacterium]
MRHIPTFLAAVLLAAALAAADGCSERSPVTPRVTINGHTWTVDLATTRKQRYDGLSGRTYLAPGYGMLFVYPTPRPLEFCMRGCPVPIDIAFIGADMRVIKTYQMHVEPNLEEKDIYPSDRPAQFALEVAGGTLVRAGVKEGDVVTFSADMPPPAKAEDEP